MILWLWGIFAIVIASVLALDLGVFHKRSHAVSTWEAATWVSVWVGLALLFNLGLFLYAGTRTGIEFFTGYLVELSLSADNIFVFVILFAYFGIAPPLQHRVLFWGILGAVILRLVFIFSAVELLERFDFLFYVFGLFLVYTGVRFLRKKGEIHPERNAVVHLTKRFLPVTSSFHGERFFVREPAGKQGTSTTPAGSAPGATASRGRLVATPLFLVLVVVEATDVVFAVDSVPAILGVTRDRFVAYTSNVFAILGLRSMYFLLASVLDRFYLLHVGLSLVLIFIGVKMLAHDVMPVPAHYSLVVVVALLGGSVAMSLAFPKPPGRELARSESDVRN